MRTAPLLASLLMLGALASGCSDDSTPNATTDGGDDPTATTAGAGDGGGGSGDESACPDGHGTLTVSAISGEEASAIEGAGAATYEGRVGIAETEVELADAVAVPISDGAALTFYLTDYELDHETAGFDTQDATDDQLLVTLFATIYQSGEGEPADPAPIEAGEIIPPSQGSVDIGNGKRVFDVIIDNGEKMHNESVEPEGQIEILYLDDERVCFSVDYTSLVFGTEESSRDVAKHLSGTFSADLVESMF